METANLHVRIAVAVNEVGEVRTFSLDGSTAEFSDRYKQFLSELQNSSRLWTLKVFKLAVPLPVQYEDLTKD